MKRIILIIICLALWPAGAGAELLKMGGKDPCYNVDISKKCPGMQLFSGGGVAYEWGTDWNLDSAGNPMAKGKFARGSTYKQGTIGGVTYYFLNPSTGNYTMSGVSDPPIESGVSGGLLVQGDTVNHITGSTAFTGWSATELSASLSSEYFFNGDLAYALVPTGTGDVSHDFNINDVHSATTGQMVTVTVWAKSAVSDWLYLRIRSKALDGSYTVQLLAYVNLSTTTVGSNSGASNIYIVSEENGWKRVSLTFSMGGTNLRVYVYAAESDGDAYFGSDGGEEHCYIGNVQVEEGLVSHSPIPTLATPVGTSGVTVIEWAMSSGLTNMMSGTSEQGTIVVKLTPGFDMYYTSAFFGMVAPSDTAVNGLYVSSAGRFSAYDGTSTAYEAETGVSRGVIANVALKWGHMVSGASKFQLGVDTGSGISWGDAVNWDGDFILGDYLNFFYGGFGVWNIGRVRIYDEIRTDDQINALF